MFHISPLVCFLIYAVKSRFGHDRSQSFGPISHVSNLNDSDFGHVRTHFSIHKLRNTQGKIYGTYLGNICGI